ncbi:MAG: DUF2799 domain-containing protein [Pseudomonadota bacterium]
MRHMVFGAAALVAGGVALSACATLNEDQCSVTDWRQLGQSDGGRGLPQSHVAEHQKACARFGISVDAALWTTGWQEGIRAYCTPLNGLSVGKNGRSNLNACPVDQALAFNEGHRIGRAVHEARRRRDAVQRELDVLVASLTTTPQAEIATKQTDIQRKQLDLQAAQFDVTNAERQADLYEGRLAFAQ